MASAFHQKQQVAGSTLGISLSKKNIQGKGYLPINSLTPDPLKVGALCTGSDLYTSKDAEHLNSQSSHLLTKPRTSQLMIS